MCAQWENILSFNRHLFWTCSLWTTVFRSWNSNVEQVTYVLVFKALHSHGGGNQIKKKIQVVMSVTDKCYEEKWRNDTLFRVGSATKTFWGDDHWSRDLIQIKRKLATWISDETGFQPEGIAKAMAMRQDTKEST